MCIENGNQTAEFNAILREIFTCQRGRISPYRINRIKAQQWPEGVLDKLCSAGVLTHSEMPDTIWCSSCITYHPLVRAHIVLEEQTSSDYILICPNKKDPDETEILPDSRQAIRLSYDMLECWETSAFQIAKVVANLLGFDPPKEQHKSSRHIKIGVLETSESTYDLLLDEIYLTLRIASREIILKRVLYFDAGELVVDKKHLLQKPTQENDLIEVVLPDDHKDEITSHPIQLRRMLYEKRTQTTRDNINKRHGKPRGSQEKQRWLRDVWATGKYKAKSKCAEQEYDHLGVCYETARKYLRNQPDPPTECDYEKYVELVNNIPVAPNKSS